MVQQIVRILAAFGGYFALIAEVAWVSVRRPPASETIRNQLYLVGVSSFPIIAITGFTVGAVLAAQSMFQLADFGVQGATGLMVTKSMLVELGPVLTAFMITGRVGAAMCAELGTMKVTEQIDALRSMCVNPARYLVAPRFIAGTIMVPLLTFFSCIMGVIGGYIVAVYYYNLPGTDYLDPLPTHIKNFDLLMGFTKSLLFGILIVTISCYRGMITTGGAAGVGRATTNSVVMCYAAILVLNFFLTIALNGLHDHLIQHYGQWL